MQIRALHYLVCHCASAGGAGTNTSFVTKCQVIPGVSAWSGELEECGESGEPEECPWEFKPRWSHFQSSAKIMPKANIPNDSCHKTQDENLTIKQMRELWKNELLPQLKDELRSELRSEIEAENKRLYSEIEWVS